MNNPDPGHASPEITQSIDSLLEARARQQAAVAGLGLRALEGGNIRDLLDEAVSVVAETLNVDLCKVLELLPDGESLRLQAGAGFPRELIRKATVSAGLESQAGFTLSSREPVIVDDLRTETRFSGPPLLHDLGVVSGISAIIHGAYRPYGVIGAHTTNHRRFTSDDCNFLQSVANVLAAAISRVRAELALSESEERFRSLVEMAPDVIFSVSPTDGLLIALSPAFEFATGWSRRDWLGRPFSDIIHPEDRDIAISHFKNLLNGMSPAPFELRVRTKSGDPIIAEFRTAPKIENGRVVEVFGIARNTTERRASEQELKRSRDELEIVLRGVADGITVQDPQGKLVYANETAARLIGFDSVEALLSASSADILERFEMLNEQNEPLALSDLPGRRALRGEPGPRMTIQFRIRATGEERWSIVSATPVFSSDGTVQFAVNIFHDVTDRMRVELNQKFLAGVSTLLASSLDYETTLSNVANMAVPFLAEWCIFDILQPNGSLRRIAASANPELVRVVMELIESYPLSPDSPHPVSRVIRSGEPEFVAEVTDAHRPVAELGPERVRILELLGFKSYMVVPLVARSRAIGAITFAIATSSRRYTASDLELAEELARRAATAIDNSLLYREAQEATERMSALAEASRTIAEASLDLQRVLDTVTRAVGELLGDEAVLRLLSEDGDTLRAKSVFHPDQTICAQLRELLLDAPQPVADSNGGQVLRTGQPVLLPMIPQPGQQSHPDLPMLHSALIVPLRVRDRILGTLGVGRTEPGRPYTVDDQLFLQEFADRASLAIENARLYREAQDAVRAREQFLSIASHELKTPLTSVKASSQLLSRRLRREDADIERSIVLADQLQGEVNRLENLVADLLDATRIQQGRLEMNLEQIDLVALALQCIERFDQPLQRTAAHVLHLDATDPVIGVWDASRLDQVITNLISNALKYSPDGGNVRVTVRRDGDEAVIDVSDEGIGISTEEQSQLFQPFARGALARQSVGGTGLGLFISAEIVHRHNGEITVVSERGRGSTFTVRLPLRQ